MSQIYIVNFMELFCISISQINQEIKNNIRKIQKCVSSLYFISILNFFATVILLQSLQNQMVQYQ